MLTGTIPCAPKPGGNWLPAAWRRAVEPVPPVRSLVPEIDARWNDVIALCLQREIDHRPASADDVVRALVSEARDELPAPANLAPTEEAPPAELTPLPARSPSRWPAGRRAWPWKTAAAGSFAVVLVAAVGINRRAPPRAAVAVQPAPESATAPAQAAPQLPPSATAPELSAPQTGGALALPDTPAADLLLVRRSSSARHPGAPRPAHHDQVAAPEAEFSNKDSPAAQPGPEASQAPPPPRRSADPNDGFIFK